MQRTNVVKLSFYSFRSERRYHISQTFEVDFTFVRRCVLRSNFCSVLEYLYVFLNKVVGEKSLEHHVIIFVERIQRQYGWIMFLMHVIKKKPFAQSNIARDKLTEEGIVNEAERTRHVANSRFLYIHTT
jgi:hypothetical protein